ncbi:MAG: GntR family transcriptional regulator [Victivallales bacterium]|nr:GntR family transcriptional regulator [Victivallales bacterium]
MGRKEEIVAWLKEEIRAGRLSPGSRAPSEYDLAERFGVNKTTANKAMADLVTAGVLARGRRGSGTFVHQLNPFKGRVMFISTINNPYNAQIVNGAQRMALSRGYLMCLSAPAQEEMNEFVAQLSPAVTSGIMTATFGLLPDIAGVPVIHIDREFPSEVQPACLINCDGFGGAEFAVREFLDHGHRDIVMIDCNQSGKRQEGFLSALNRAGVGDATERLFISSSSNMLDRVLDRILSRFPRLSGIVTASDNIAFELLECLNRRGLKVPQDISVSGFGNVMPIASQLDLTSIEQNPFELGAFAAERLMDMIEGKYIASSFCEVLPCSLVRRNSIRYL